MGRIGARRLLNFRSAPEGPHPRPKHPCVPGGSARKTLTFSEETLYPIFPQEAADAAREGLGNRFCRGTKIASRPDGKGTGPAGHRSSEMAAVWECSPSQTR